MQPVATAAEMRALDQATIDQIGLPGAVLMETAGRAVAAAVRAALGDAGDRLVVIVCGGGNNGGDGFVVARVLRAAGIATEAHLVVARAQVGGDARRHLDAHERSGGAVFEATDDGLVALGAALARARVVVDAVLGTGLTRPVAGHLARVIEHINRAPGLRLAVDLPSGLSADTGHPLGAAVRAHRTVTMALPKLGIVTAPGFAWAGAVEVAEIGIPRALIDAASIRAALVEAADVEAWRPRADPLDHKGRRGHVLVVGGSPGKRGAARLAAIAALRAGAGLCTMAGPADATGELTAPDPVMTAVVASVTELRRHAAGKAAIVIGPGMPDDARGRGWIDAVLATAVPLVIDATGLAVLADAGAHGLASVASAAGPVVLTPHPGEAARLLGITTAAVEADRMAAVRQLAATARAVVVLKGARTLVCDGTAGDFVTINPTGGPALATGGSGDVLAGLIGALLAQGLPAITAARLGVWVHGAAGDALATRFGDRGVMASDLPDAIAIALR